MRPFYGGEAVAIDQLAAELAELPGIEGVTFSGGEPMAQAGSLARLVDELRRRRDFSFVSYSGYTLQFLVEQGTAAQRRLLDRLDILIDGPYVDAQHSELRWRGSGNQQVCFLTDRYRHLASTADDHGIWIEFEMLADGALQWMGIPPRGFRDAFLNAMDGLGIELVEEER